MTNPKTTESRAVTTRAKPSAPTTETPEEKPNGDHPTDRDALLAQLVALTRSIGDLAQQSTTTTDDVVLTDEQVRVTFAYNFLGSVLGRRAPSLFALATVDVTRDFSTLTFKRLGGATAAIIRSAGNVVRPVEGLREGVPVRIDDGEKAITDDQRIDSIITFTVLGGLPVAVGPCLDPVGGIIL